MGRWLFLIALGAAGAIMFRTFAYEGIYVASASMEPSYPVGRHVMVNKMESYFRRPKPGDVVMFDSPVDTSHGSIKRVIAVEGQTVEMRKKRVIVDGHTLHEPYVQYLKPDEVFIGDTFEPVTVPKGTVFLLGDNRDVSGDSRDWKDAGGNRIPFLPVDKIQGYVH
jgi:signal peptidase I